MMVPALQRLRDLLLPVLQKYHIRKAIVFGSFARGEATRRSDIDLILIQETDKRFFDRYDGLLYELNLVADHPVEALIYTPEELLSIAHRPFIETALREGKVIYEQEQESLRV
jgi:predicted nucleotidyltransferase